MQFCSNSVFYELNSVYFQVKKKRLWSTVPFMRFMRCCASEFTSGRRMYRRQETMYSLRRASQGQVAPHLLANKVPVYYIFQTFLWIIKVPLILFEKSFADYTGKKQVIIINEKMCQEIGFWNDFIKFSCREDNQPWARVRLHSSGDPWVFPRTWVGSWAVSEGPRWVRRYLLEQHCARQVP